MKSVGISSGSKSCDASRSLVPTLLLGAVCGLGLTIVALKLALGIGLMVVAAALARRKMDRGGMFALGFVLGITAYMAMAIVAFLNGGGVSIGSRSGP